MGRKGNWLSSVKKAFSHESKKKKSQKVGSKPLEDENLVVQDSNLEVPHPLPPEEELNVTEIEEREISFADSEAVVIATEDEAVFESSPEVVTSPVVDLIEEKLKDDVAAIKIQSAFRGHQARRSMRAQRGLQRLQLLIQGTPVKRQTATALKCMQTLSRVQTQIQSRRIRMSEENQALHRQLLQNRAKELASLRVEEDWDDSPQSKEELEASLLNKYEAAMRREKAMAYSFTHQQTWKKSQKPTILMFMDPNNPQWGWSWLERWTESTPWDTNTKNNEKEIENNDDSSTNTVSLLPTGEITKAYAHHLLNGDSPSTLKSRTTPLSRKLKFSSPKEPISSSISSPKNPVSNPRNDDPKSPLSSKSEKSNRRHSTGGPSSMREKEGLGSPRSVPSYMAPTKSVKAKLKSQSPLGLENVTPEKDGVGPTKKRLSFPGSPARPRRHSGPPKVDLDPVLDRSVVSVANGESV